MKIINIRKGIFETNSSSTHSVVIANGTDFELPKEINEFVNDEGLLEIEPGEYGWEYDKYKDWQSKASYAYTYAFNYGKSSDLEILRSVIEEFTGKKIIFKSVDSDYHENGYIDHQSIEEAERIFESYETVKTFIFGRKSYVITDNDNH